MKWGHFPSYHLAQFDSDPQRRRPHYWEFEACAGVPGRHGHRYLAGRCARSRHLRRTHAGVRTRANQLPDHPWWGNCGATHGAIQHQCRRDPRITNRREHSGHARGGSVSTSNRGTASRLIHGAGEWSVARLFAAEGTSLQITLGGGSAAQPTAQPRASAGETHGLLVGQSTPGTSTGAAGLATAAPFLRLIAARDRLASRCAAAPRAGAPARPPSLDRTPAYRGLWFQSQYFAGTRFNSLELRHARESSSSHVPPRGQHDCLPGYYLTPRLFIEQVTRCT
jgi:hypothetical protein